MPKLKMTLEKAIEILTHLSYGAKYPITHDELIAICLDIEALKRCQSNRGPTTTGAWVPLPGETEN